MTDWLWLQSPLWICSRTPTCRRRWRKRPSCSTPTRPSPSTSTGRQRLLSYSSSVSLVSCLTRPVLCHFSSHPALGSFLPAFLIRGRLRSSFYRVNQVALVSQGFFKCSIFLVTELHLLVTGLQRRATEPRHLHMEVPDIPTADLWVTLGLIFT